MAMTVLVDGDSKFHRLCYRRCINSLDKRYLRGDKVGSIVCDLIML